MPKNVFGVVSIVTYGLAITGMNAVELFVVRDLLSSPDVSASGSLPCGSTDSLRPRTLNAPYKRKRIPWVDLVPPLANTSPTSNMTALESLLQSSSKETLWELTKGLSTSPLIPWLSTYWIETVGLLYCDTNADRITPLSLHRANGQACLQASGSTAQRVMGG